MGDFVDWLKKWGANILVILTILQVVLFAGYSALYTVVYKDWNPDATLSDTEIYEWISIFILTVGMVYFLFVSLRPGGTGKLKNPNELFSYLALGIINNTIFLGKLCYNAYSIKKDWIDGVHPDETSHLKTLTVLLWVLTFVSILGVTMIVFFMCITAKPLRDYIYSEIFYEIGANINSVEQHKAKTSFFGTIKVDLVTHLLYLNTLSFLCYDFTKQHGLDDIPYWCVLGVAALTAFGNNYHGHRIMRTTAGSCNTKVYFVTRTLLQCVYLFVSLTLIAQKTLWWSELDIYTEKNEVRSL